MFLRCSYRNLRLSGCQRVISDFRFGPSHEAAGETGSLAAGIASGGFGGATFFISKPRPRKISSRKRRLRSASRVAFTTLAAFLEPRDLLRTSFTPADSKTARTVFPAMTPVPGEAGRSNTFAPQ